MLRQMMVCSVVSVLSPLQPYGSAAARMVGLRTRITPGSWILSLMSNVGCADTGLCERPIPLSVESYPVWCVSMCAIRRSSNHLQLQWVGRRGLTKFHVWRYSPFRTLASLIRRLHSSLFSALLLHPLIPGSCNASLWTTSAHLILGLPTGLVV